MRSTPGARVGFFNLLSGTVQIPVKGLDVEERGSVQRIEAADDERSPHAHEVHEADGDGVRLPVNGSQRPRARASPSREGGWR